MSAPLTVCSLDPMLTDSLVVNDIADSAGITAAQMRAVLAALDELPIVQVSRMTKAAKARRVADVNRETRRNEPR